MGAAGEGGTIDLGAVAKFCNRVGFGTVGNPTDITLRLNVGTAPNIVSFSALTNTCVPLVGADCRPIPLGPMCSAAVNTYSGAMSGMPAEVRWPRSSSVAPRARRRLPAARLMLATCLDRSVSGAAPRPEQRLRREHPRIRCTASKPASSTRTYGRLALDVVVRVALLQPHRSDAPCIALRRHRLRCAHFRRE